MRTFEQLDTNKDGKLSIEEFLKVAEAPFSTDGPGVPPLEERKNVARAEFQNLDTDRDGFVERAEAEALVHSEFNKYDTDRDNRITEPELRRFVQEQLLIAERARQQEEARKRQGMVAINDFIDMQLREADRIDKNGDGRITRDEFVAVVAGPVEGPQAQGLPPYDLRKQLALRKFQEIDTNKDGVLDRVELTGHAVEQFLQMDANKDHFLNADEFKKAQEAEAAKIRATIQTLIPAQAPGRPPAPAPAPRGSGVVPTAPPGLAPGLPQGTH
jgi:Ca2+-binding EF-hand superfamily protein